jgi:hypothetical protein
VIRAVLAFVCLAIGGLLAYQWKDWPPPNPAARPVGQAPVAAGAAGEADPDPLARLSPPEPRDAYAAVIERPLFRPERKPPDPDENEPEQPEPEPEVATTLDGMDLSAVVITGGVTSAWVKPPGSGDLIRLRLGDDLEGWSVKEIQPDRLVLERQGERDELPLRDFAAAPPAMPPTPTPARPRPDAQRQAQGPTPPGRSARPPDDPRLQRPPQPPPDARPPSPRSGE